MPGCVLGVETASCPAMMLGVTLASQLIKKRKASCVFIYRQDLRRFKNIFFKNKTRTLINTTEGIKMGFLPSQ